MKRPVLLSLLGALALVPLGFALAAAQPAGGGPVPCPNPLPHEPVVVYDVSGYGLAGLIDRELIVFADGTTRLSSATLDGVGSQSRLTYVGTPAAVGLARDLVNLGARNMCDDPAIANDVPLSTLTLLGSQTDTRAHTFSWWVPGSPQLQAVQDRLQSFIATHFP